MRPLVDSFGREFHYLRLSLEDSCNLRCLYCLPEGFQKAGKEPPLTLPEIRRLAAGLAGMGFWKVRLTGGEPAMRRDLLEIAAAVSATPGVRKVLLSTNGLRLRELAAGLKAAGVRGVNVSVDSLDPERFARITGQDRLGAILAGIERCLALGLETKINVVLMRDLSELEISRFLEMTKELPVCVRFIELMPTAENREFFNAQRLSALGLLALLQDQGWVETPRQEGDGPARIFRRDGHAGSTGVIAPYSERFCSTCNRLRVTSRGALRLCLFAEADFSLRPLLQEDCRIAELQETVRELVGRKEVSHYLPEGRTGNLKHFAMVGG